LQQENSNYYSNFLDGQDILTELETLPQPGQWTNSLCDALPLAVADVHSVTVKIYSSKPDQPVITVVPSLVQPSEKQELILAYLSVPDYEHYD